MRQRFRRWRLPSPEEVQSHRSLRWLGPLLKRPWLWHLDRRSVALGAAIERGGEDVPLAPQSWGERVAALGKPLVLGLSVFAVVGAALTWLAVNLAWIVYASRRRVRAPPDP